MAAAIILFNGLVPLGAVKALVLALPIGYLTTYIGLLAIPKMPIYSKGDYSYGIYLYGFPIQQMLVMLYPGRFMVITHFICSMLLVTCVAMLSWHCIEKPILKVRKKFSFTARLHP